MMDAPGGAREPRFGSPYGMGLLGDVPDMYGGTAGRPPSALGAALRPAMQPCPGVARALKRPSEQCYDERPSQSLGLDHCPMPDIADDGYASLQPKKSPPSNGKKTKGRVKIKMEYIDNKLRRYTTFSKRKTGIMKKAYELSTLTGTQVMLLVASETGHVYTFATRKLQPMITSDSGKRLIQTCLNSPDPPTTSEQRMAATGFEETELTYNVVDDDIKDSEDTSHETNIKREIILWNLVLSTIFLFYFIYINKPYFRYRNKQRPLVKEELYKRQEEPTSSGDSGDESGSEPDSPADKSRSAHAAHAAQHQQHWPRDMAVTVAGPRSSSPSGVIKMEPTASTSSSPQEADSSKCSQSNLLKHAKLNLPGGAMLYHPGVLAGIDGLGPNLGLGNLAMTYPHGFILGLANQGQEAAASSSQPQFITIPLSMAMAAAAGAGGSTSPAGGATSSLPAPASSDDSSELQDLTTGNRQ